MAEESKMTGAEATQKEVQKKLDRIDFLELVNASKDVQLAQLAVKVMQQELAAAQRHAAEVQKKAVELETNTRDRYGMGPSDKFTPDGEILRGT